MKIFMILTVVFIYGCSSDRVLVKPRANSEQTVAYVRGAPSIHSQSTVKLELIILDYSYDEMLISLSATNTSPEALLFSEKNVGVELLASGELQDVSIFSYEQLLEQVAENEESNLAMAGNTAVGIGASFIPFGSIAYSVGRLIYSISNNTEGHQKRIDKLTFSQLNQNYLRQQVIPPGNSYKGILKLGFENDLQQGDEIILSVVTGNETQAFNFICNKPALD